MDSANDGLQSRIMSWQTCVHDIATGSVEKHGPRIVTYLAGTVTEEVAGEKGIFHKVEDIKEFEGESERVIYSDFPLNLYRVDEDNIYLDHIS